MQIFGVTGSFGTGKTTVSKMLGQLGAKIIDCDKIAHKALKKKSKNYKKIISFFGKGILNKNTKDINRKELAKIAFGNRVLLKRLSGIIHPFVIKEVKQQIALNPDRNTIVIDAPLLIEANLGYLVDKLIVVKAKRETQIKRIKKKTNLSRQDILSRINSQISLKKKTKLADYVIDNDGSFTATLNQVKQIYKTEKKMEV